MSSALRLSFCPRCDYLLQGLPDSGVCPECGTPYDQSFVVLRGRPVTGGAEPNGQSAYTAKRLWWSAGGAVIGGALIFRYQFVLLSMVGWWAVSTFSLLVEFVIFVNVIRPGEVLVWAGPGGIGQQPVVDPESKLPRLRWLVYLFGAVFTAGWAYHFRNYIDTSTAIIWIAVFAILAVALIHQSLRRTKYAVPPYGIRPGLFSWNAFAAIRWRRLGDSRYELWTRQSNRVRPADLTHVQVELTPDQAAAFERLLEQWTEGTADLWLPPKAATGI